MSKPALRVFSAANSPDRRKRELDRISGVAHPKTVAVALKTIIPLLIDAANSDRTWLADFADDTVRVDSDLYDVLLAYSQLRQSSAA